MKEDISTSGSSSSLKISDKLTNEMKDCVHKKRYLTFRKYIYILKIGVVTT